MRFVVFIVEVALRILALGNSSTALHSALLSWNTGKPLSIIIVVFLDMRGVTFTAHSNMRSNRLHNVILFCSLEISSIKQENMSLNRSILG